MQTAFVKYIGFPIQELMMGRNTMSCLSELEKTQWYQPEKLKQLQFEKFIRLLEHAYENVPFYREKFQFLGLSLADIETLEDISKLPLLSKKEIRENWPMMMANGYRDGIKKANTSGTSGEATVFYLDKLRMSYDKAAKLRYRRWWDIDIGEKKFFIADEQGRIYLENKGVFFPSPPCDSFSHLFTYNIHVKFIFKLF